MKQLSKYIKDEQQLNENAEMIAAVIASTIALDGYNGYNSSDSNNDRPGFIKSIIDNIKDKRKQKIVAGAFEKLKNDKDIEELFQKQRKQYIEELKKINRKHHLDKSEGELTVTFDNYVKAYHNVGVLNYERKDEMIKLIKSKLDKKELKYIDDIFDEIRHQKKFNTK